MIDWDSCVLWLNSRYFSESYWWDRSKYRNDGAVHGAKWKANAFYFDGSNDYVKVINNSVLDITNEVTIEAWIKCLYSDSKFRRILCHGIASAAGYQLCVHESHIVMAKCNSTDYHDSVQEEMTNTIQLNKWYHVVGVYDNGSISIYLNGKNQSLTSQTVLGYGSGADLYIGKRSDGYYFKGYIETVRIYNETLSNTEIEILYNLTYRR